MAILDSFHFKVTEEQPDSEPAKQEGEEEMEQDEMGETATSLPQRIHSSILNTILPGLESCLTKEVNYSK